MLDSLLDLVKQNAGSAIINNPAIPNERNDEAVSEAGNSIVGGLQQMISGGNIQDVIGLFTHQGGNMADHPAAQQLTGGFVSTLMNKFGLDQSAATSAAASLIPTVLQKLVSKTNDPNDSSFDIQSIVGQLSGGSAGGLDIGNLVSQFTQGKEGGNIMDSLKGMFGK
jgi:Bacterial protein of unknown function (DUF937)